MALVASLFWLVHEVRDRDSADGVTVSDRDAAMIAARGYIEAASNFGPKDLDEQNLLTAYRDRVSPLVSTSYKEQFEQQLANVTPLAVQGFGTSTTVDRAGVVEISDDRAKVLVGGETARSLADKTEEPTGYTLEIWLVKSGGTWLVDRAPCNVAQDPECTAVTEAPAEVETPGDPSAAPSDEGSKRPKEGQQ